MSSWQTYVDQSMLGTGKVQKGVIIGHNGAIWADNGSGLQGNEGATLVGQFSNPSSCFASGVRVGGNKYLCIKADDRSIYGKKGAGGVVCVKTKQAVVIGLYDESTQPGECTKVVEGLADYLIEQNF